MSLTLLESEFVERLQVLTHCTLIDRGIFISCPAA